MRVFLLLILSFLILSIFSQEGQGYVIKLNSDTVVYKSLKIDRKKRTVNCVGHNGKRSGFDAEEVLGLKIDTSIYESGFVRLKSLKRKRFIFLQKTIVGNLNLYEINVKKSKLDWRTVGENLITLRWIYRSKDARIKYLTLIYFYKMKNETRKDFSENWKEKTKDCKLFVDKISSKETPWAPGPRELVQFYNTHCN